MPDLLHEYWYDEEEATGAFGPVGAHADRQRAALNPKALLLFSLRAASFNQAMQASYERLGYGAYVPVEGVPDHFYTEAERAEQEAYLRVRPSSPGLAGMTVNERLFTLGLMDEWDRAAFARDREAMLDLMRRCAVDRPEDTVDTVLATPSIYGYALTGETGWRDLLRALVDHAELGPALPLLNEWAAVALLCELGREKVTWTEFRHQLVSQMDASRIATGDRARLSAAIRKRFRSALG